MSGSELAARVRDALSVSGEEFASRVEEEVTELQGEIADGTFDNPQAIVGLEYEFYAVDAETDALARVPRRLLEYIGFEKELGLHNAEMQTSPQPLSPYGLAATRAEVQAKLAAAQEVMRAEGMRLVSDGIWTVPPVGTTASGYLTDSVEEDGVRLATHMSDAVRYHAMANTDFGGSMNLDAPYAGLEADTVMPESLITSIQPHYQVAQAADIPTYFRYALRIAGPLLAVAVNSPLLPPDLYADADPAILAEASAENRVYVFESVLNPDDEPKVTFPEEIDSVEAAIRRVATDRTVVPMLKEDTGRFDDRFAHFRHKHGSFWRWVRPVFDGPTRTGANARIEFRPLPAQPTVPDSVAMLALYAGVMEALPVREHPVWHLSWEAARDNFYAAVDDGLDADLRWLSADGEEVTDTETIYEELFAIARDGLKLRGLTDAEAESYVAPIRERVERGVTPAGWKRAHVDEQLAAGDRFGEAIWGMQAAYIDNQEDTLIEGSFVDWLDDSEEA